MILSALVINCTYSINAERPYDLFRFCFQLVVLSCSEFAEVALRIIILEIHSIAGLMEKPILSKFADMSDISEILLADDILRV